MKATLSAYVPQMTMGRIKPAATLIPTCRIEEFGRGKRRDPSCRDRKDEHVEGIKRASLRYQVCAAQGMATLASPFSRAFSRNGRASRKRTGSKIQGQPASATGYIPQVRTIRYGRV